MENVPGSMYEIRILRCELRGMRGGGMRAGVRVRDTRNEVEGTRFEERGTGWKERYARH